MNFYQYIIFLSVIIILIIAFGLRILHLINITLQKVKPKNDLKENFFTESYADEQMNVDVIMPDLEKNTEDPTQYPGVDIKLGEPLPGDEMKYLELDKIYINPFYPEELLEKPKQNYKNPDDMSSTEKNAYKYGYPNGMTMQDYVNWLSLFKDSPDLLNLDHNINYQKLIKNVPIKYEEGRIPPPAKKIPPHNSEQYFQTMYSQNPERPDPLFSQTINAPIRVASNLGDPDNGILASNYKDYPRFASNFDVMGNSQHIYNNELAFKTDPYFLRKFIGPTWTIKEPKLTNN